MRFNLFRKKNQAKNSEFKFKDSKAKAVFTCNHVIDERHPILNVTHDIDGDWQFLCGQGDHSMDEAKVISLKNAIELDNTLNDLFELPMGVGAERTSIGKKWKHYRITE